MLTKRLQTLIAEMLDLPEQAVTSDTVRADTESWDSLNHLQLVTAIESEFGVKFTMDEIAAVNTAGDLQQIISSRTRDSS
jgi:acyl carrier protein